ncbi:hypothetical protein [Crossiella sp. CA198]|uniref:hypothetical protein n=1 Tax=Crossiella sp. CA198 TaxID=3455607 RepID=UPI003F8D3607
MPRLPKNFRIDSVTIERLGSEGYLPAGPDTAVPMNFEAHFQLGEPQAAVRIEVFVAPDHGPIVLELNIRSNAKTSVTTSVLRQVLVDQLLREAMTAAVVPASVREEWLATLPSGHTATAESGERTQADLDAHTAAQIYSEAVASGSKSPAVVVGHTMGRSRAQAARYIRRARELGILPPLGSSGGA